MHIVCLHRTQGHGVEAVHVWGIVNGFKSLGHNVTVVSPAGVHTSQPRRAESASNTARRTLFSLVSERTPELVFELAEIAYNIFAWRRLKRSMTSQLVDCVYERYAIFAVAGAWFARRRGIPLLLEVNYTSRSPLVRKRSKMLLPLARRVDEWLFRQATAIVVVSSQLREQILVDHDVSRDKILLVPNAADPTLYHPAVTPVPEVAGVPLANRKVVGFVGSFAPWHGLGLLLDAFKLVAESHADAVAVLVGDGPQRKEIERRVVENGLADRVLFAGAISHDQLMHCVATFSVGVMPDSNDYGSPMKVFEYMALGKPVVVPDYSPLLDVVTDKREGRVFRRQDAQSLAACINDYFADPVEMAEAGRRARASIEDHHNWRSNADRSLSFMLTISAAAHRRAQGSRKP